MAVTNLLPAGDSAAEAVFTLTGGQTMTLAGALRSGMNAPEWRVHIERKMSDGAWESISLLHGEAKMLTLYGDGEYRVRRSAGNGCIVDGAIV